MKKYTYGIFAAALLVAFMAATGLVTKAVEAAVAACTTEVITEADIARQAENTPPTQNWVYYTRGSDAAAFRSGPGAPQFGTGSFEITTPTGADKGTLFNYDHVNTLLSQVNQISYSTYRRAGDAQQVAAINLQVDVNGAAPGGFTTLVFEPVYNTAQGTVVNGEWQTWDAYSGGNAIWWSSNPIPGAPNRDTFVTLASIVAANPNAVIVGGVGINQGSGNPGLTTAIDAFTFGTSAECFTYNFELNDVVEPQVPMTKDDCKNDRWKTLVDSEGNSFKNQGQCVAFVASGGKSGKKK
ncbi:hypothetical protein BH20ACI2_BH20ACI2_26860 [soil metagenome]